MQPQQVKQDVFALPVAALRGVGARISEKLERLGVHSIGNLLCLLPRRYEDRTQLRAIGSLRPGDKALVTGHIELAEIAVRRRRSLLCRLADGTGALTLRFFHFSPQVQQRLVRGAQIRCFGEVRAGRTGLEMVHPEWRLSEPGGSEGETALTPVYPTTEGLHQQRVRELVTQSLARMHASVLTDPLADWLDESCASLPDAFEHLHRPPADVDLTQFTEGTSRWHRRLAIEELIAHRLSLKASLPKAGMETAVPLPAQRQRLERLSANFGFQLTNAQRRVVAEILRDISSQTPMVRLVQGDVGCGKTVVACAAALTAADCGRQVAFMAPTELLAEQHYANLSAWLAPLNVDVELVTGSQDAATRARVRARLGARRAVVAIGTHALFQEGIKFSALALVIIDEQHRFGVEQRLQLWRKGTKQSLTPHQLIMTATPIPRTLAMTAYADLEFSTIDELPPGRRPVRTVVLPESRRAELTQRLAAQCAQGRQAYWVCPLIEESEHIESSAAIERERELREALPGVVVGLVHGRMRTSEKDDVMRRFKAGDIGVLVATTVIEVGVDVPNATMMVIENAERMGLAQLHQLRGRVGRGMHESGCVLLYKPPLGEIARARLQKLRSSNDGFEIAREDLRLRGPGEVLGTRQTGVMQLRIADLSRDADLLPEVVRLADRLLAERGEAVPALIRRWIPGGQEYANV
ncbi:MAG: ATP-dependent DNA helicase RecG [Gammaproteobacteria bacterium]